VLAGRRNSEIGEGVLDPAAGGRGNTRPWLALAVVGITLLGAALRLVGLSRLPPGQYLDESIVNIIARDSVAAGQFHIYYPESFGGYHPAVVYTAMLWRWLTGGSPYALRYGVAVWSALSLPLIFFALRAIFQVDQAGPRADWLALAGTLIVAITAGYIINSRTGFEVTLPTPLAAATFMFLAQGLRVGRRRYFVLAGAALGLSLYTYYSARFLPAAVTVALAWLACAQGRAAWRARAIDLLVVAGCSLVIALPLLWFFARHPDLFFARALLTTTSTADVGPSGLPGFLLNSTLRTLGGLVLPGFGDILPRQNLPGRPMFDAFLALCLVLGLVVAVRRPRRTGHILLISWAAIQLAPAAITMVNNSPHFTRLIAATPALAGLAALGLVAVWEALRPGSRWLAAGIVAGGLCFSLAATIQTVFINWPKVPALYVDFLVQDWQAANLALARSSSQDVFLSPDLISRTDHASFDLLLRGGPARDFPGPGCLLYREAPDRPMTYIVLAPSDPRTTDRLAGLFPAGHQEPAILHAPGQWADYLIFQVPAGAKATAPQYVTNARFGDAVRLVGYDLSSPTVRAGGTLTVTLYWQALQPALSDYSMFVHLYWPGGDVGAAGVSPQPVAQSDGAPCGQSFPTPRWQMGEIVVDERTLTVPADFQFGSAPLALGVYGWPSLERLPVAGQVTVLTGDRVRLGEIKVQR
jgi:Dolichyl-phosphate-mannose-protein mannosyltransferase